MIDRILIRPFGLPPNTEFPKKPEDIRAEKASNVPSFSEVLKTGVLTVSQLQNEADNMTNRLALGELEDISQVSIAVEKAELALRLMVQIRDKMLEAYNQISRIGA